MVECLVTPQSAVRFGSIFLAREELKIVNIPLDIIFLILCIYIPWYEESSLFNLSVLGLLGCQLVDPRFVSCFQLGNTGTYVQVFQSYCLHKCKFCRPAKPLKLLSEREILLLKEILRGRWLARCRWGPKGHSHYGVGSGALSRIKNNTQVALTFSVFISSKQQS